MLSRPGRALPVRRRKPIPEAQVHSPACFSRAGTRVLVGLSKSLRFWFRVSSAPDLVRVPAKKHAHEVADTAVAGDLVIRSRIFRECGHAAAYDARRKKAAEHESNSI
jgi:hypothetical protein